MPSWLLALALVIPLAAELPQPNTGTGTVSGKVTYRGKPLAEGLVTFVADKAKVYVQLHEVVLIVEQGDQGAKSLLAAVNGHQVGQGFEHTG